MPKSFDDFLNNIDNERLVKNSMKYLSKSNYSDDTEKQIDLSVAISKSMLEQYHKWLNS